MSPRRKTVLLFTTMLAASGSAIATPGIARAAQVLPERATVPTPGPDGPQDTLSAGPIAEQGTGSPEPLAPPPPEQDDTAPRRERPATEPLDTAVVVTGTRLGTNDPTSDIKVYTADDINALGVSNVQDFMRTLPQNQVSVGYGVNNRQNTEIRFDDGGLGGLGVGGVNLRGLGTKNTLVLVNGRRVAGAAGIEEGFANINNIPLAAIDRVEISLGGGSSIYGSDALGGVVNFILKRGYTGFSATTRTELSSTGADTAQWTGTAATSWGSGSITATGSYTKIKPALNRLLGYTTHDYTDLIDEETLVRAGRRRFNRDLRSRSDGAQPATIQIDYTTPSAEPGGFGDFNQVFLQWAGGSDHSNPRFSDLAPVDFSTIPSNIPTDAGERQASMGFSINIEQKLTDRLRVTLDYLGSINRSNLREVRESLNLAAIPFEQAYSPIRQTDFPDGTETFGFGIYYYPTAEYADGRLRPGFQRSKSAAHTATLGVAYDIDKDTGFRANYTYSSATASGTEQRLLNVTQTDPQTGICSADADTLRIQQREVANLAAIAAAQCAAIRSTDPARAFNFLSNGSATTGAPIDVFFVNNRQLANETSQQYGDALFTAAPFTLPGGKVRIAIGGEMRGNRIDGERIRDRTAAPATNRVFAGYTEVRVPVVGGGMNIPFVKAFDLSLNARYDNYSSTGPVGTVDNIPFDEGGQLTSGRATFDRISPRVGIAWSPVNSVTLRGSWSSNFTPPPFTSLYDVNAGRIANIFLFADPLAPDGRLLQLRTIELRTAANPQLRPEVSQSWSVVGNWAPQGPLSGLNVEASYYNTVIDQQIGISSDLENLVPAEQYFGVAAFFPRDAAGNIVAQVLQPINIGRLTTSSVEVQVDYSFMTRFGMFTPSIFYTRNLQQKREPLAGGPSTDVTGRANGLDRYRVTSYLDFRSGRFSARLTGRYIPPYDNYDFIQFSGGLPTDFDGDGEIDRPIRVKSMTTFDLNAVWRYNDTISINAGGRNIFKAAAPFALIDRMPFDAARYDIRGRVLYLEAQLSF